MSFAPLASGSRPVTRTLLLFREVGGSFTLHRLCCGRQHKRPRTIATLSAAHSTRARVDAPSCGCARRGRCSRAAGTGTARRRRGSARYGGVSRLRSGNTRNLPVHLLACRLIWPGALRFAGIAKCRVGGQIGNGIRGTRWIRFGVRPTTKNHTFTRFCARTFA